MSPKSAAAPKKKAPAKPNEEAQIKRLQGRVKKVEDRVENLVQVLSNRLNFNADNEPVDIIKTGELGESTSEPFVPAHHVPEVSRQPNKSDSREDWDTYARAQGLNPEDFETKEDLILAASH